MRLQALCRGPPLALACLGRDISDLAPTKSRERKRKEKPAHSLRIAMFLERRCASSLALLHSQSSQAEDKQ